MNERISMREFQPVTLDSKLLRIRTEITQIEESKQPYVSRKQEIELELSKLNSKVRTGDFSKIEYNTICNNQDTLKDEKRLVDEKLIEFRDLIRKKNRELDTIMHEMKRVPDEQIKETLLGLRDKYMSFASDTTRVSSMRSMASKFAEELQVVLKMLS
jgi:hypothetical protein